MPDIRQQGSYVQIVDDTDRVVALFGRQAGDSTTDLNATETGLFNVKTYGAVGDGTTDDTAEIQTAINAAVAVGGGVFIPTGLYKLTAALTIGGNCTILGEGCEEVWGTTAATFHMAVPVASPWLNGSVLYQTAAATDCLTISASGVTPHLKDFGIRFADAIAFNNTGHGVNATPSATTGGFHDSGVYGSKWENLVVFGHDGNHYAFTALNPLLCSGSRLRGYGGGGLKWEADGAGDAYGNGVFNDTFFALMAAGSAHGYHMKSRTGAFPGDLNLMTFVRPQCNVYDVSTFTGFVSNFTISAPTTAQNRWKDEGDPPDMLLVSPDLECAAGNNSPVVFGVGTVVVGSPFMSKPTGGVRPYYRTKKPYAGIPVLTFGTGAGTSPSGTIGNGGNIVARNDERGQVNVTTGSAPAGADGGAVAIVTLEAWNGIGAVLLQPVFPLVSLGALFYPKNITANKFEIWSHLGLAATTSYSVQYHVVE